MSNNSVISRKLDATTETKLSGMAEAVDGLVEFGAQIISWDISREKGSDSDLPPPLLLRNFIEQLDAISILIKASSIEPCNNFLRTAVENFFALEYILRENKQIRCEAFLYFNALEKKKTLLKADGVSEEYKRLLASYKKDILVDHEQIKPVILSDAKERKKVNEALLQTPHFDKVRKEYDRLKEKAKDDNKKFKIKWYSLFEGPTSIIGLAEHLGFDAIYEMFYRYWSKSVHGSDVVQGILKEGAQGLELEMIRDPESASSIAINCRILCLRVYKVYLEQILPEKLEEFETWAMSAGDKWQQIINDST